MTICKKLLIKSRAWHVGVVALALVSMPRFSPAQYGNTTDTGARVAAVAAARGEVNRARAQLQAAVQKVRTTWQANPQYIEATDKLTAARKDYDAARRAVIDKLKDSDPTYAKLTDKQGDVQEKLEHEQAKTNADAPATTTPAGSDQEIKNLPGPTASQVAAAQAKLDNKVKLRNLEDKAVAADPDAAKAQAKLNEAQKESKVWQAQLDAALLQDADYRAARDQLTSARSRLVSAGATDVDSYDNYGETVYVR